MDGKGPKWTVGDALFGVGSVLISLGVALMSAPAGLITLGGCCLLGWFLTDRSGGDRR